MSNCSVNLFDSSLKLQSSTYDLLADTIETNNSNIQYAIFAGGFSGDIINATNDVNVFICNDDGVFRDTRNNTALDTAIDRASITTVRSNSGQSYALIGGGYNTDGLITDLIQVLICNDGGVFTDTSLNLFLPTAENAATTINTSNFSMALIAGGDFGGESFSSDVDAVECNDDGLFTFGSPIANLNQARRYISATTIKSIDSTREYALFAGGEETIGFTKTPYNDVDCFFINDGALDVLNVEFLSQPRFNLASTTIQSASGKQYSLFAGGAADDETTGPFFDTIDVYVANDTGVYKDTSSVILSNPKSRLTATTLTCADGSSLALFAGGADSTTTFNDIDIYFANDDGVYFEDNIVMDFESCLLGGTNLVNKAGDQAEYAIFAGGVNNNFTNFSNDVNVFLLSENNVPCFIAGSLVTTDQGDIHIENLKPGKHTIAGKNIINITSSISLNVYNSDYLIVFDENSLGDGIPFTRTVCSPLHKIFYENKMTEAKNIMKDMVDGVYRVPYRKEKFYNVQLENYGEMIVNGMKVETLHPTNTWAKISK